MKTTLKHRLLPLLVLAILIGSGACTSTTDQNESTLFKASELFPEPPRPEGQTDVIELRCDPIDTVRIAFIGVGSRGTGAVRRYTFLEGVKIVALCDMVPENLEKAQQIIEDAVKTMESRAEAADISIIRNYTFGLPQVRSGNLFQVFCNLAKNALDAMSNGGRLRISTSLAADDTIMIELRDTGTGFPPESTETIFEPFFTTKEGGKGTGLGLAICRDIVESYHGRITQLHEQKILRYYYVPWGKAMSAVSELIEKGD